MLLNFVMKKIFSILKINRYRNTYEIIFFYILYRLIYYYSIKIIFEYISSLIQRQCFCYSEHGIGNSLTIQIYK